MAEFALPRLRAPQGSRGTLVSARLVHFLVLAFALALSAVAQAITPQVSAGEFHTVVLRSDGTLCSGMGRGRSSAPGEEHMFKSRYSDGQARAALSRMPLCANQPTVLKAHTP